MKKVAIVGANSYIARNLTAMMSAANKATSEDEYQYSLYDHQAEHADGLSPYTRIDILDEADVANIDYDADVIFMFVGKTGSYQGFDAADSFIDINERSLLTLLTVHRAKKSKARIIFPSTRLVYKGKVGKLTEEAEKELKSIYAVNKYSCEQYLQMYQHVFAIPYTIFRICVPYGTIVPGASSYGTAEIMLGKANKGEGITLYGDGTVRRTLTHIEDLCRILLKGAFSLHCLNDVFNIGGEDYSLAEMANLLARRYGVGVSYVPWPEEARLVESGDTVFDSAKLDTILGEYEQKRFDDWCREQ
ncbi:MAG: NAD(P)-dependent oxidoreductase [Lachnospiraceae bacterium]|jgi:UDP-glucose 4-epimerase|nr:NAD(P)-dependent oxidoreductase [Lachnospiraceae bacterium]